MNVSRLPGEHTRTVLSDATPTPRRSLLPLRIPLPVITGTLVGAVLVLIWSQMSPKWSFYIFAGLFALMALPVITRLIGHPHRLLAWIFLFSLQFYLSFNLVVDDHTMPGGVQGINITLQFLAGAAYLLAWHWSSVRAEEEPRVLNSKFAKACFWYLVALTPSLINTTAKSCTVYGLFYRVTLVFVALAACHICSSRSGLRTLWQVIWVILVSQAFVVLIQRSSGVSFDLTGEMIDSPWGERVGGTMGAAPVSAATLFAGLLLFAEIRLVRGDPRTVRRWAPAFCLGFLCLLLSLTRSAWIQCGLGSVFILIWMVRNGGIEMKRLLAIGALTFLGLAIAQGPVRERMEGRHHDAAEERWKLNYVDWEMIKAHPITGIGLNTIYDSKLSYVPSFFTDEDWVYIAHNEHLTVAAETGVTGWLGFIYVLVVAIRAAAAGARSPDRFTAETAAALWGVLLVMAFVGMNLDFYSGVQVYVLLWFMLGCAAGVEMLAHREMKEHLGREAIAVAT